MKLSIIIPVFNEKNNIENVIESVKKADALGNEKEIIVIDDYSTDGSREILQRIDDIHLVLAEKNGGKGAAIKLGLPKVTGDFILFQDADLEYSPDDYKNLIPHATKETVVFGSRYLQKNKRNHLSLGVKMVNIIFNFLFKKSITDIATCYKIFPVSFKNDLLAIKENDFVFDVVQATVLAATKAKHIHEVGIYYSPRAYAEGKKLRLKHGLRIAMTTVIEGLKYRFSL